jgi:uncharacterized caspase-like protein
MERAYGHLCAVLALAVASLTTGCTVISPNPGIPVLDRQPTHADISVALYVPGELAGQNPVFTLPDEYYVPENERGPRTILIDEVFAADLQRLIGGFFPQAVLTRERPRQGAQDLLIRAMIASSVNVEQEGSSAALEVKVQGTIEILTLAGLRLEQLSLEGVGHHRVQDFDVREGSTLGVFPWRSTGGFNASKNLYDLGRIAAEKAMREVYRQIADHLSQSRALDSYIASLREERAQPCELLATVRFEDSHGLLPNQRLDAGETGELVVQVENRGPGAAYAVSLDVSSDDLEIKVPVPSTLGELPPGSTREVRLPVKGGLKLAEGRSQLLMEAREKRGYHARKALLELATTKLVRPELVVVDILLSDRDGKTQGDGDGQPANGEVLEGTVFVRNTGAGDAGDVGVLVRSSIPQVEILESPQPLGTVPAGQLRESRFLLRLPHALTAREIEVKAIAIEGRGKEVSQGELVRKWPILSRRPSLELDWRVFDGTSPASEGNRDGKINNGERIEILLTASNRGQVEARDVGIEVANPEAGIAIQPSKLVLPDLPAGTTAAPVSLVLQVPRTFEADRLLLRTMLKQRDFPGREQEISLPVVQLLPSLAASIPGSPAVHQGERRQFQIQIENRGLLEARDVVVQVRTRWPDLEILDKATVPLGSLASAATALPVALDLFAKRSSPSGKATLEVTVQQADFPPASHEIPVEVAAESPVRFQTEPEVPRDLRGRPTTGSSPVIVFRKYESNQIVADEEVTLAFEIYDDVGLANVSLTHNRQPLRLTPSTLAPPDSGSGQAQQITRYTVPLKLALGMNKIEVTAINFAGMSLTRSLTLIRNAREGQVWAAVIGVSRYQDSTLSLQYADTDAEAFGTHLRNELGVAASHILILENEQATRRRIIEAIGDWLPDRSERDDTVFIYFAGHGTRDKGVGNPDGFDKYLLPYDTDTASYNSTSINFEDLKRQIERLRAARIILILDTCFSGAAAGGRTVFDSAARTRGVLTDSFLRELAENGKGTVLLMASGVNELAFESPDLGRGVFTYFLLEGLRGKADAHPFGNVDGLISVDEAYLYASRKVREKTRNNQNPQKFGDSTGEIILGRAGSAARQ